ncbi:MAG: proton-conducting transporter membrane subunit [Pseudohongiella sp.]|nr:proton-conducting transporter membrane subunit [Pseudohongiella sp.]
MIEPLLWITVPLAPLLFLLLLISFPKALTKLPSWIWVSCVPALVFSLLPPATFSPDGLWPGASLGGDHVLLTTWLAMTAVLWAVAGAYAADSMREGEHLQRFWVFWLLALSGNLLLIISQDAMSFYVGFSMMSLSAYGLVIHNGTSAARRAGRLYLQLAVLGEVLLLSGLLMQAHAAQGSFMFIDWVSAPLDPLTALLLITGLGLKAGFWPLHVWLPLAHPAAPAPASAVLSGAMIKAGIFGLWMFLPDIFEPASSAIVDTAESAQASGLSGWSLSDWSQPAMVIGLISAFFGVVVGLTRTDAKQVLAYSSVSQMGYLLFILALSWQLSAQREVLLIVLLVYAVHHGFAKAALFLSADLLKSGKASGRTQSFVLIAGLLVPALALCGLIFSSGAAAKAGLKDVLENAGLVYWLPWLQIGAMTSTLLLARASYLLFRLQSKAPSQAIPRQRFVLWASLSMMPVLLPWLWMPMNEALLKTLAIYKIVELSWPVVLGISVAGFVIWRGWQVPHFLTRMTNPFLLYSIHFTRRSKKALLPAFEFNLPTAPLRSIERRWNRYWQGGTVNRSAALLLIFMVVAAVFMLIA